MIWDYNFTYLHHSISNSKYMFYQEYLEHTHYSN